GVQPASGQGRADCSGPTNYMGKSFTETQILYLMRNVPDQCSAKAFCKTYGDYTDALLGMPLYAKFFADKSMTRTHYLSELRRIVVAHHVGALILDCVEHLLLGSSNQVSEFIAMLINMRDELRVPIILVGTPRAAEILKSDVSTSRRIVEGGYHELQRPISPDDPDFSALCEVLWKYQWVKNPTKFSKGVRDLLYDLSQGITGVLITLFICAQIEAIDSGKEKVGKDLIKQVYEERLKPLHPILNALRTNNQSIIQQYDDLYPRAFDALRVDPLVSRLAEIYAEMTIRQERSLGIMEEFGEAASKEKKKKADADVLLKALAATEKNIPKALL
ncbi:TniB family NTP-binding protein, partial [Zoogloea sp.]|uniref:TniB family NTP-binding protein n=1 Tax=Zoogloea sp. TaxID=49181 RepID=UPI0035B3B990